MNTHRSNPAQAHQQSGLIKALAFAAASLLPLSAASAETVNISALQGSTATSQWSYQEWFSRYSNTIDSATLAAFKNSAGDANGLELFATANSVKVSFLGTGATRNANLFLAFEGTGSFNSANFWNPVYASGGTNNTHVYNPVNSLNALFETRAGCSFAQAKNGNTCQVSQIGQSRTISNVTAGERLVFGLQALPLAYNGGGTNINIPNTHYFFTGNAHNNTDARGWADAQYHAKVLKIGENDFLVGYEDQWLGRGTNSDRDFNDLVFRFEGVSTTSPIPEPGTALLLLPGLALMAGLIKRRRRAQ